MTFFKYLAYGVIGLIGVNLIRSYLTDTYTDGNGETWEITHEKKDGGGEYWYATAMYGAYKNEPYPPTLKADSRSALVSSITTYAVASYQKKAFTTG